MTFSLIQSLVLSLVLCAIPIYAFRLTRGFGAQRVGWILFIVFSVLAALMLIRAWQPLGLGVDPVISFDVFSFLIPILLLIGMSHIGSLLKERSRLEKEERRLRAQLEEEVKQRTGQLNASNDELQREITLRRQGAEELRKSKEQYRFLFEENPQPMWIFDLRSFQFLAYNRAALRHYGYSSAELANLTAKDLCSPEEIDQFVADASKSCNEIERRDAWRHYRKDGSLIEVDITAQDLMYAERPARLVLAHDITAQRSAQSQVLQSQKLELTAQLAGGAADNFNKLISMIEGDANALLERFDDPEVLEPLKRISANAACAGSLTRQLLALVRRHPMRLQPVDLNRLIESQAETIGRLVGNKIAFEKSLWENLPAVMADPALIDQILRNLVLNARDAMPNGGTLTVSTTATRLDEHQVEGHEAAKPGVYVCLTVNDTGCGMNEEVRSHLFEPFFTTKGPGRGMGMGLSTVSGLVRQHSGWVEVDTHPGSGSRFTVFLPCAPAGRSKPTLKALETVDG